MHGPTMLGVLGGVVAVVLAGGAHAVSLDQTIQHERDYVSPERIPGATTIGPERAHELWQQDVAFVDPRPPSDYKVGHIPGSVRLQNDPDRSWVEDQSSPGSDLDDLTEAALQEVVAKDEPVVFYCNGTDCGRSSSSAALAVEWGWQEVYYFRQGFPGWQDAGHPVATADEWPEKTRGEAYYADHPEKARWMNKMCDRLSITAWTRRQEKHCKEAKLGLLEFLKESSQRPDTRLSDAGYAREGRSVPVAALAVGDSA